ncbi:MAG: hypothetical protein A2Y48_03080 [Nitrospirae bacterium RIFCSPLOW2_12_42_9]|nr:MAG: hypothetical protein A2Y48_03080 [Nitrospirae bacterium RIFCSPLOW2_12_42_9]
MDIKISVVIPCFNAEKFISHCLDSVVNQTYPPYEVIVCDDASKDRTREVIKEYQNKYPHLLKPIFQEKNAGSAINLNTGLKAATGNWIVRMDGDDLWTADKLYHEVQKIIENPDIDVVYSDVMLISEDGKYLRPFRRKYDGSEGHILAEMLTHEMSFRDYLFRKEFVDRDGFFDPNIKMFRDWDHKIRLLSTAKVGYVNKTTVCYRNRTGGMSKAGPGVYLESLEYIYKKHERLLSSIDSPLKKEILNRKYYDFWTFNTRIFRDALQSKKWKLLFITFYKMFKIKPHQSVSFILNVFRKKAVSVMKIRYFER